jgi:hypothetical protein
MRHYYSEEKKNRENFSKDCISAYQSTSSWPLSEGGVHKHWSAEYHMHLWHLL